LQHHLLRIDLTTDICIRPTKQAKIPFPLAYQEPPQLAKASQPTNCALISPCNARRNERIESAAGTRPESMWVSVKLAKAWRNRRSTALCHVTSRCTSALRRDNGNQDTRARTRRRDRTAILSLHQTIHARRWAPRSTRSPHVLAHLRIHSAGRKHKRTSIQPRAIDSPRRLTMARGHVSACTVVVLVLWLSFESSGYWREGYDDDISSSLWWAAAWSVEERQGHVRTVFAEPNTSVFHHHCTSPPQQQHFN